jgi:hypothetical protein
MTEVKLRVISLGAGVQSTTMALMAARSEIGPMPDCAIFADTGWEPKQVYKHLEWLISELPFPVHIVSAGNIRDDAVAGTTKRSGRFAAIPWFVRNPDGSEGMGRRQCTTHYKIEPIRRKVRALLGGKTPKGGCEQWIGISTDEALRMRPSRVQYTINRWPLIERGISRADCLAWMAAQGYPTPPKSACIGCPFHNAQQWREIKADPVAWRDAVEVDEAIRDQTWRGFRGLQFMHRQRVPLAEADLRTKAEKEADLFNNDCEGMCGV